MSTPLVVTIEKLVFGGQGLAHIGDVGDPRYNGKTVFVWNALAGETVEIEIIKKKKQYLEAVATHIVQVSPHRIPPTEEHFLSTSAWDIMTPEQEAVEKRAIAAETYSKIGGMILNKDDLSIGGDGHVYGYRNKLEFSFTSPYQKQRQHTPKETRASLPPPPPDDPISLAFFTRGGKETFPIQTSRLAMPHLNDTALHILSWINDVHIPIRSLKSLIVRSNTAGQTIATLFLKDKLTFTHYPALTKTCIGIQLYYSTHKSPASVPTSLLYTAGADTLSQDILGTSLSFGALSFFQINPPVFELALKDIAAFLNPKKPLVDMYAGVGAISLPLAMNRTETILVESNDDAVSFATHNISVNNLPHATAYCTPAERMTDVITRDRQIILDPPRAGLHKDVIRTLLRVRPSRIIYLSCNISTQARDMHLLSEHYTPIFMKLYNFFPRTPHIEGLVILE